MAFFIVKATQAIAAIFLMGIIITGTYKLTNILIRGMKPSGRKRR